MNTEQLTRWLQRVDDRLQKVEARDKVVVSLADMEKLESLIESKARELARVDAGLDKKIKDLQTDLSHANEAYEDLLSRINEEPDESVEDLDEKLDKVLETPIVKKSKLAQLIDIFK